MGKGFARLDAERISGILESRAGALEISDPFPDGFFSRDPTPASVLVPLVREADEWHLLFIRRSDNEQDRHSGQVAFPGGRMEPQDPDPIATALRETHEEIGLRLDRRRVLGTLNSYRTISNYLVTPVVAQSEWPTPLTPDPREVSHVFTIPLTWLADRRNRHQKQRQLPGYDCRIQVNYFAPYQKEILWGITAKITLSLLSLLEHHSIDA